MSFIRACLIIVVTFLVFPFFFGLFFQDGRKRLRENEEPENEEPEKELLSKASKTNDFKEITDGSKTITDKFKQIRVVSILELYSTGFVTQLAVAWCVLFPMLKKGCDLSRVTHALYAVWGVLALCGLLFYFVKGRIASSYKEVFSERKTGGKHRARCFLCILCAITIIWSLFYARPSADDATVETMRVNVETGTIYEYNPYSGDPYGGVSLDKIDAPLEVLYAVMMRAAGLTDIRFFVEVILRIFLLLAFYAVIAGLAEILFQKEKQRNYFFVTLLAFYILLTFLKRSGEVQVYRNIWMDRTMLFAIVGPSLFGTSIRFIRGTKIMGKGSNVRSQEQIKNLILLILGMIAAQMVVHAGFLLALPFGIATIVTGLICRHMATKEKTNVE